MQAKLNRGPMKNKRVEVDQFQTVIRVAEPLKRTPHDFLNQMYPTQTYYAREGTYYRSNVKLKDGTPVFEWMGWLE